jgi:hypothetical protein
MRTTQAYRLDEGVGVQSGPERIFLRLVEGRCSTSPSRETFGAMKTLYRYELSSIFGLTEASTGHSTEALRHSATLDTPDSAS